MTGGNNFPIFFYLPLRYYKANKVWVKSLNTWEIFKPAILLLDILGVAWTWTGAESQLAWSLWSKAWPPALPACSGCVHSLDSWKGVSGVDSWVRDSGAGVVGGMWPRIDPAAAEPQATLVGPHLNLSATCPWAAGRYRANHISISIYLYMHMLSPANFLSL